MDEPILIGIGSTEAQMLAVQVLSYTLHKHTERALEIVPLFRAGIEMPKPQDPRNAPRTPFSFQRFLLPRLGGFKRKTIYLDSDMIVFSDIGQLYDTPMEGADVLATQATPSRKVLYSVLLIDPQCPWKIDDIVHKLDSGDLSYAELMFKFKVPGRVEVRLPYQWNSLERYEPGETKLLHYTDMWLQPWLVKKNPLADIWIRELCEAIDAGFVAESFVAECVEKRWARPSLLYQVQNRCSHLKDIPLWIALQDIPFTRYCRRNKYRIF
jgi:hypothetical protein